MYLIKRILIVVLIVITANAAYSQKKKKECNSYSWDFWNLAIVGMDNFSKNFPKDTTIYVCIDSNIVKGLTTAYPDSIRIDIFSDANCVYATPYSLSQSYGEEPLYRIHYPITLKDNPLFQKAIYCDDCWLSVYIARTFRQKEGDKKGYCILSSDGIYVNYAFLEEKDGDLYAKYNPLNEDNNGTVTTIKSKKFWDWLTQELETNKNQLISVAKNGKVYIVKLFNKW